MKINRYFLSCLVCSAIALSSIPAYSLELVDITSDTFEKYDLYQQTDVVIKDTEFFTPPQTVLETSGNVLSMVESYFTLSNTIFRNIYTTQNGNIFDCGENGLISLIEKSNFYNNGIVYNDKVNNNAVILGGLIRGDYTYQDDDGRIVYGSRIGEINSSRFTSNSVTATTEGEYAYIHTEGSVIDMEYITQIKNSTFSQNKTDVSIQDSALTSNTSAASINTLGTVIHANYMTSIEDSDFTSNKTSTYLVSGEFGGTASTAGGVIDMVIIQDIKNSNFSDNSIKQYTKADTVYNAVHGGVLHSRAEYVGMNPDGSPIDISSIGSIQDSRFISNSIESVADGIDESMSTINGGVIWVNESMPEVRKSVFDNNSIKVSSQAADASVFVNGGVIYSNKIDNVVNSQFSKNKMDVTSSNLINISGGIIAASEKLTNVRSSEFSNNQITASGNHIDVKGGVIKGAGDTTEVHESKFINNTVEVAGENAVSKGGVIYVGDDTQLKMSDNTFTGNKNIATGTNAVAMGGAIYNGSTKSVDISDTSFINNSATKGGAIYSESDVNITSRYKNVVFSGNSATLGSNIYVQGHANVTDLEEGGQEISFKNSNLNIQLENGSDVIFENGSIALESVEALLPSINPSDYTNDVAEAIANAENRVPTLNVKGEGSVILNAPIQYVGSNHADVVVDNRAVLVVKDDSCISNPKVSLTLKDHSTLDIANGKGSQIEVYDFSTSGNLTDMRLDLNLDGSQSDYIHVNSATPTTGNVINISGVNILSDATNRTQQIELVSTDCVINADATSYTNENQYTIATDASERNKVNVTRENDTPIDGFAKAVASTTDTTFFAMNDITTNLSVDGNEVKNDLYVSGNNHSIDFTGNQNLELTEGHSMILNNISELKNSNSSLVVNRDAELTFNSSTTDTVINSAVVLKSDSSILEVNLGEGRSAIFKNKIQTDLAGGPTRAAGRGVVSVDGGSSSFVELEDVSLELNNSTANLTKAVKSSDINTNNSVVNVFDESEQVTLNSNNSTINLRNRFASGSINMTSSRINVPNEASLDGSSLSLNDSYLNIMNGSIGTVNLENLTVSGENNMSIDVNLADLTADKINAQNVNVAAGSKLNVAQFNITENTIALGGEVSVTDNQKIKDILTTNVTSIDNGVYSYGVSRTSNGDFSFRATRFDPAVLVGPLSQQAFLATQLNTYNQAFTNMDMIMLKPYSERMAARYNDKLAIDDMNGTREYLGHYRDYHRTDYEQGPWFRPYGSIENIRFHNGPKVDNYMYGSSIGYDSNLIHFKNGLDTVISGYIAYNGSIQDYQAVRVDQNGATAGLTTAFYKNNFFTGLTLNGGVSVADAKTGHGSEDFTMVSGGAALKTGYNFEAEGGMCIFQPSLLASYTYINTPTYTNSTGLRLHSDALNAVQLEPGIKFIFNFENHLQAYMGASAVFSIGKSQFGVYNASLPRLAFEPYGYYKFGLQKRWGERNSGYTQAAFRSGGRNGAELQLGWRFAI